jgi:long-chain acyl-CoA synthetase
MGSALDRCARLYGHRPAIIDREGRFSWHEHLERVRRAAGHLQRLGLRPGDRFGIVSRNTFRLAELLHAGYWSGLIPVPINTRLAHLEMSMILVDAGVKALALEAPFAGLLDQPDMQALRATAFRLGPSDAGGAELPDYDTLIADAPVAALHPSTEDDDAILLYTGGTTGRGKGVRLTHRNVVANGLQMAVTLGLREDEVYLHVAPMFHSADLLGTGVTLQGGAHAFLAQFSPQGLLAAMQDLEATWTMLAPTMIILMLQDARPADYDLSRMRTVLYGSAPMAPEWTARTIEAMPQVKVVQGYGLTETSPILTVLGDAEHRAAMASGDMTLLRGAGRPLVGIDLCILGDDGKEVPVGEAGEVCVRGPNVTRGYLDQPEATAAAFYQGWFRTGDLGRVDERGYLFLLDRKKDMVITGGENVYSSEVEQALYQHPGVSECAVVGIPDVTYGEALLAVIVPARGHELTTEAMIAHCRGRIGGYKIPRHMVFVPQLPKSAMGKILKTELRKLYRQGTNKALA